MTVTIDGTTGISAPGVTDTGNLSVTGTSTLTGAVSQTSSSTAASFIPTGSTVPANGMYLSAANTLNLATNTTNQVSISSGGIVTGTAGNLMLVQGTSQASTSGTAIDFTGIPSWAKRITVNFSGVSTNGVSNIQVQIGSTTFTTSGYSAGAMVTSASGLQAINNTTGFPLESTNANLTATSVRNGSMRINLITGNTWVSSSAIGYSAGTAYVAVGGGSVALGGTLDRLRVTTVAGDTFDAGTINIQYE
jgi:hypothetical protein